MGDVTGQQWAAAGSAAALRHLAESGLIGMCIASADEIIEANDAFLRIAGYSREELLAGDIRWRALSPGQPKAESAAWSGPEGMDGGKPSRTQLLRKDGTLAAVDISTALLSHEPLTWACFVRDAAAEDEARWAGALADLAGALSRDVTVTEVARTLSASLRGAMGADWATIIEAFPQRAALRFVDLETLAPEVAGQWQEFSADLDSPAVRAWRSREAVFYPDPAAQDLAFPHLTGARAAAGAGAALAMPMITGGEVTGVLAVTWAQPRRLGPAEMTFVRTVAGQAGQALERARLFEAEKAERTRAEAARDEALAAVRREHDARLRIQALQAVTAGLATALTSEQVARVLAAQGMSLVADYGVVGWLDPAGDGLRTWTTPNFPDGIAQAYADIPASQADRTPVGYAARTGRTILLASMEEIAARFPDTVHTHVATGTSSLLAVPVRAGHRTLGALSFGFRGDRAAGHDIAATAGTLAELAGQALERAQRYESEHAAAHQLQQALLPRIPAELPGAKVSARYRPAEAGNEAGGDWYDAFELPGDRTGFAVGDVVGHDLHAAAAMSRLQQLLRYLALRGASPADVLAELDAASPAVTGTEFATVGYAEYDPARNVLVYACAGHPPPLLAAGGQARYLNGGRSGYVGSRHGGRSQAELTVPPGAMLVWYSDGLVEQRGESIDAGLDRLAALAAGLSGTDPDHWCSALLTGMTAGRATEDDIVLAVLHLRGQQEPPRTAG